MVKQTNTAQSSVKKDSAKPQGQSYATAKRYLQYFLGLCVLFIVSAVSFCPVTQAALANVLLPIIPSLKLSALTFSTEGIAYSVFFGLLVIGLSIRTKYQG
ncbi:hypothetical protein [Thalassotalea euphylliae]|uniref:Uncharacterized protein n=1 Tax=Thalassotalea euphylliae TaxID=1655234 RepID=A0A3E0TYZ2_9GAMM|nr:hypothetical protein [Thalassotalea euphylliae]REL29670.1 hypothetical protein DXX94_02490 [Thalassotalea euphylliae]